MNDARSIPNHQVAASTWLQGLPKTARFLIGLPASSVIAYFLPVLLLALFGHWINILSLWTMNALVVLILILLNIAGIKMERVVLFNLVLAALLDCYAISLTARMWTWHDWPNWWQNFAWINTVLPLNAAIWLRFQKAANL